MVVGIDQSDSVAVRAIDAYLAAIAVSIRTVAIGIVRPAGTAGRRADQPADAGRLAPGRIAGRVAVAPPVAVVVAVRRTGIEARITVQQESAIRDAAVIRAASGRRRVPAGGCQGRRTITLRNAGIVAADIVRRAVLTGKIRLVGLRTGRGVDRPVALRLSGMPSGQQAES